MRIILASNNKNKLREFREMLSGTDLDIVSQREAGLMLDVDETGTTFYENALLKAKAACDAANSPAFADDSGLMIDFLGGEPGVYSARYGGEGLSDDDKCSLILEKMKNAENRNAKFVSCIVGVFPNGDIISALGECHGVIAEKASGENGFGYDPIFYIPQYGKTMAEMSADEKNAVSHRGKSLAIFKEEIEKYFSKEKINADK